MRAGGTQGALSLSQHAGNSFLNDQLAAGRQSGEGEPRGKPPGAGAQGQELHTCQGPAWPGNSSEAPLARLQSPRCWCPAPLVIYTRSQAERASDPQNLLLPRSPRRLEDTTRPWMWVTTKALPSCSSPRSSHDCFPCISSSPLLTVLGSAPASPSVRDRLYHVVWKPVLGEPW